jgi:hypothetical protein
MVPVPAERTILPAFLLNEPDRVKEEMGIRSCLNQVSRFFYRFAKSDVLYWYSQDFAARFVIFDDPESEVHRIEGSRGKGFFPYGLQIRYRMRLNRTS